MFVRLSDGEGLTVKGGRVIVAVMKEERALIQAMADKAGRFTADPHTHVPCLECAKAIDRNAVDSPRKLLCSGRCLRRFKAQTRSTGRDPEKVFQAAFRTAFRASRGTVEGMRQALPELPHGLTLFFEMTGII